MDWIGSDGVALRQMLHVLLIHISNYWHWLALLARSGTRRNMQQPETINENIINQYETDWWVSIVESDPVRAPSHKHTQLNPNPVVVRGGRLALR